MEMNTALLFAFPILLGVIFSLLARWARQKNQELAEKEAPFLYQDFWFELRNGRVRQAARKYFLGSVHSRMASAGSFLAAAVIFIVALALVFVIAMIVGARG